MELGAVEGGRQKDRMEGNSVSTSPRGPFAG